LPTILRIGPYRFFFYSADGNEPPHIHVERDAAVAKFWLRPIRLQQSGGLNRSELREIERLIVENLGLLEEAWDDYFGS
jgi:hypothetical protein